MNRFVLFINSELGLRILDFILQNQDSLVDCIVLNNKTKLKLDYPERVQEIIAKSAHKIHLRTYSSELWNDIDFIEETQESNFGISALFGHIIPEEYLNTSGIQIINLHPSLLPVGRGADPVAWSIIEGNKQGVTIHELNGKLDEGRILLQNEIVTELNLTSGQIYLNLMDELYNLFVFNYKKWVNGQFNPIVQKGVPTSHKSSELEELRAQLKQDGSKFEPYLKTINALNYGDDRKAILKLSDGMLWQIEIKWTKIGEDI